jgi:hypothetical protein
VIWAGCFVPLLIEFPFQRSESPASMLPAPVDTGATSMTGQVNG